MNVGQQAIGALRERLQHEAVAVAIDDERREQIGFTVHEPVGAGIDVQGLPVGNRRLEPRAPDVLGRRGLDRGSPAAARFPIGR